MKEYEVKKVIPKTVFKTILMAGAIPFGIILIILLLSLSTFQSNGNAMVGTVIYFIFMPIVIAIFTMIYAVSYNWLAPKFGGLKIHIDGNDEYIN